LHIVVFDKYGDRSGGASGGTSVWSEANEPTETTYLGAGGSQP